MAAVRSTTHACSSSFGEATNAATVGTRLPASVKRNQHVSARSLATRLNARLNLRSGGESSSTDFSCLRVKKASGTGVAVGWNLP